MKELKLKGGGEGRVPTPMVPVLMLIDIEGEDSYFWTIGTYTEPDWMSPYDKEGFKVVEWYELPRRKKINEDYSYKQMRIEEFWNDK